MLKIVIIIGPLFSGKTTFAEQIQYQDFNKVEVADLVRAITKKETRTFDPDLDNELTRKLLMFIRESVNSNKNMIIIGMRQKTILEGILLFLKNSNINPFITVEYKVLQEDKSVLQERFSKAKRAKDKNITFEKAYEKEMSLGLEELIKFTEPFKSN